jgi:hypothetical protein
MHRKNLPQLSPVVGEGQIPMTKTLYEAMKAATPLLSHSNTAVSSKA